MNDRRTLLCMCALGLALVPLLVGCGSDGNAAAAAPLPTAAPAAGNTRTSEQKLAKYGLKVYEQQYCGVCHTLSAAGTNGTFGPTHDHVATTAEQRIHDPSYTGKARTAEEYIRESMLTPQAYIVSGYKSTNMPMPSFNKLSQREIDGLVQLLLQQK